MPKILRNTKAILYLFAAIFIFLFHEQIMPGVAFLVGGVVLVYALEELFFLIMERKFADMAEAIIQIVLAVLLFLAHDDIIKICIIWGVWSIIREGREMTHALVHIRRHRLAVINIVESVVVTVLSAIMILNPGEHHAHTHVILLGIELLLEIAFPLLETVLDLWINRKKEKDKSLSEKERE
ncbi:MAG: hypothetical protein II955_05890 [Clostridia bacterium]|nr:hypothetical protein [Clostridia bacterium]